MLTYEVSPPTGRFDASEQDLTLRDTILEFLRAHPMKTAKQITDALCVNKNTVASALGALARTNKLVWNVLESEEFRRARHYRVAA